jgi:hypothetical protein
MIDLVIVGEGQTEETFIQDVLSPMLGEHGVFATSRIIATSKTQRGGGLNFDRVCRAIRNTLSERADTYVTTMLDLYGLGPSFRGVAGANNQTPIQRTTAIALFLHEDVLRGTNYRSERFLPHIQPHEFESLLFSDIDALCEGESEWRAHLTGLTKVRANFADPEWINDSRATAPSKRLNVLTPKFHKIRHGPLIAAKIGLDKIREQCPHFNQWVGRLIGLSAR